MLTPMEHAELQPAAPPWPQPCNGTAAGCGIGSDQPVGASGQPGRGSPQRGLGSLGNQGHLAVRVAGRGRPLKATPLKGDCMWPSPHRPFHLLGLGIHGTYHSAGPRKSSALPRQMWSENEKRCTKNAHPGQRQRPQAPGSRPCLARSPEVLRDGCQVLGDGG